MLRGPFIRSLRFAARVPVSQISKATITRSCFVSRSFCYSRILCEDQKKDDDKVHVGSFKVDKPTLMIAFTCKKCDTRSSHTMSKQAYQKGTVLIQCPGCKGRHLIADHLKIFSDNHVTIQDILKAKGESVSLTTDDLAFEDIPESLKNQIGHYAKDAPEHLKSKLTDDIVHKLPTGDQKE